MTGPAVNVSAHSSRGDLAGFPYRKCANVEAPSPPLTG